MGRRIPGKDIIGYKLPEVLKNYKRIAEIVLLNLGIDAEPLIETDIAWDGDRKYAIEFKFKESYKLGLDAIREKLKLPHDLEVVFDVSGYYVNGIKIFSEKHSR